MNIFDQAMEIELEGQALYRQYAAEAPNKGLKWIFNTLAEQEQRHYDVFKALKESRPAQLSETHFLSDVKDIFDEWKEKTVCVEVSAPQADFYRKALAVEVKSISVYEKYAAQAPAPQKELFLRILAEEKHHWRLMENIIDFVTKPDFWAENAEFYHADPDYYQ